MAKNQVTFYLSMVQILRILHILRKYKIYVNISILI
jgi:hypothetical protein